MKRIFYLLFLAVMFMNCTADAQKIRVEGSADEKSTMAYFLDFNNQQQPLLDSVPVSNGKFTAELPTKENCVMGVITNGGYKQFFFAEGESVKVDVVNDIIEGTGLNAKWGQFLADMKAHASEPKVLGELLKKVCDENKDNYLPVAAINMCMNVLEMQSVVTLLSDDAPYASHQLMQSLYSMKKSLEKRMVGTPLKDIAIPDADGKMHNLSEYVGKGKYVLVDFWASWCGPCCREMPNVVEAYAKYKEKGFEVVGISLDRSKDAWLKRVKELNMTWPQLSDLKFWQCEAAALYGVQAIPSNVLFDKDGKIMATDLTGAALQNKLAEIFQ